MLGDFGKSAGRRPRPYLVLDNAEVGKNIIEHQFQLRWNAEWQVDK